ncbi:MAG: hypothetical protein V4437_02210 [Patescibacteria group bacterium]
MEGEIRTQEDGDRMAASIFTELTVRTVLESKNPEGEIARHVQAMERMARAQRDYSEAEADVVAKNVATLDGLIQAEKAFPTDKGKNLWALQMLRLRLIETSAKLEIESHKRNKPKA